MKSALPCVLLFLALIAASMCQMLRGPSYPFRPNNAPLRGPRPFQTTCARTLCDRGAKLGNPCGGDCVCGVNFARRPAPRGVLHCVHSVPGSPYG
ncbi:hypothetical protein V5799_017519 [Amblyomma americanum]|uniref:Secreted protein n=1 Tax=Amblyomma americanum TaxID=6943 RepID=A0AAQ4F1W3_AMBAM